MQSYAIEKDILHNTWEIKYSLWNLAGVFPFCLLEKSFGRKGEDDAVRKTLEFWTFVSSFPWDLSS